MRHELLAHIGVAVAVAVSAGDADWQRGDREAAVAALGLEPVKQIDQKVGTEAVVADEHDMAEVDIRPAPSPALRPAPRVVHATVEHCLGHPLEADAITLDLRRQAMAEHDDRGGRFGGDGRSDGREKVVTHACDRLISFVLLVDRRRAAIGLGDGGDLLGTEATRGIKQPDDGATGRKHRHAPRLPTDGVDEAGEFCERGDAVVGRKRREPIGMLESKMVQSRFDLPPVLRITGPRGKDRGRHVALEGGEVRGDDISRRGVRGQGRGVRGDRQQAEGEQAVQRVRAWHHRFGDQGGGWMRPGLLSLSTLRGPPGSPNRERGECGGIDAVPEWFAGGGMLAAGGFCYRMPTWPTGRRS